LYTSETGFIFVQKNIDAELCGVHQGLIASKLCSYKVAGRTPQPL
jgi:hypothetical protein